MGKHTGDADLNFFELKNAKVHVYTAQPVWTADDEGRLIYVTAAEPDPAKRGFFRGSSSAWVPFGAGSGAADLYMNDVLVVSAADPIDFQTDIAGGKEFAEVIDDGAGGVDVEIDKQINYLDLAGGVGPVPTGFTFDRTIYRACEVIYTIEKFSGELETGHIMILHDGSVAGVVVTRRGTELLPFTQGNPSVVFSADVSGNECRLLYTETAGDQFHFAVKPRPIRINQIVSVEFDAASSAVSSEFVTVHNINIRMNTSDGQALGAPGGAGGQATDSGLGSAAPGIDYNYVVQNPTWNQGDPDGTLVAISVDILGTNVDATIVLDLAALFGCILGPTVQHEVTLVAAAAAA